MTGWTLLILLVGVFFAGVLIGLVWAAGAAATQHANRYARHLDQHRNPDTGTIRNDEDDQ